VTSLRALLTCSPQRYEHNRRSGEYLVWRCDYVRLSIATYCPIVWRRRCARLCPPSPAGAASLSFCKPL
jgi:hypothetical protein